MWHTTEFVAESRRVDPVALKAFAGANEDKYGIVAQYGRLEVSTWHVDALVRDFIAQPVPANRNKGIPHAQ